MAGRQENLGLAEFTIRVLANMRDDLRVNAALIKARLAGGQFTVAAARNACRSVGNALAETGRRFRDNFRARADSRTLQIVGLTAQQLTDAAAEITTGIQHFRLDAAANAAEIDALCDAVLSDVPAADAASDAAGTRFIKAFPVSVVGLMEDAV